MSILLKLNLSFKLAKVYLVSKKDKKIIDETFDKI